jgi:hypothetical protein
VSGTGPQTCVDNPPMPKPERLTFALRTQARHPPATVPVNCVSR